MSELPLICSLRLEQKIIKHKKRQFEKLKLPFLFEINMYYKSNFIPCANGSSSE
jgi:hypothetical protein